MCIEPIELALDIRSLRRGLIYPVDPDTDPTALVLQDSGMVPVNTQIAIVNPETCTLSATSQQGQRLQVQPRYREARHHTALPYKTHSTASPGTQ